MFYFRVAKSVHVTGKHQFDPVARVWLPDERCTESSVVVGALEEEEFRSTS